MAWLYLRRYGLTSGLSPGASHDAPSPSGLSASALKRRWRRWRMRKRLRAVRSEEAQQRCKDQDRNGG